MRAEQSAQWSDRQSRADGRPNIWGKAIDWIIRIRIGQIGYIINRSSRNVKYPTTQCAFFPPMSPGPLASVHLPWLHLWSLTAVFRAKKNHDEHKRIQIFPRCKDYTSECYLILNFCDIHNQWYHHTLWTNICAVFQYRKSGVRCHEQTPINLPLIKVNPGS